MHPVAHPNSSVRSKLHIGGQNVLKGLLVEHQPETATGRLEFETPHAALGGPTPEVAEEKPPRKPLGESGAGIGRKARRSGPDMGQRRHDPGWLTFVGQLPHSLAVPGPPVRQVLILHRPARVSSWHDVHEPGLVSTVTVVVDSEQIAEIVEGKLLGISQAGREDLEFRSVGTTAEHGPSPRLGDHPSLVLHPVAPVTDREIEPAIGSERKTVQVVAAVGHAAAVALREDLAFRRCLGNPTVAVKIPQPVEGRDTGHVQVSSASEQARGSAVDQPMKTLGVGAHLVSPTIAVGIDEQPYPVIVRFPVGHLWSEQTAVIGLTIRNRLGGQIGIDPLAILAPVVADTMVLPKRLTDKHPPQLVDREGNRVGHISAGGKEFHTKVGRHGKARRRLLGRHDSCRPSRSRLLSGNRPGSSQADQKQR